MPDPIVNVCGTGGWSGPLPGDPDNNVTLTATARYDGVMVAWTEPLTNPHAVAVYRLYRGVSADPAASVLYAAVGGNRYFDQSQVEHPPRYYYWIEVLSVNGTVGAKIGPASAQANDTIEDLIEKLTGKIEEGQLSNALKAELDVITSLNDTLIAEVANRINDNGVLAGIIAAAQAEVATALTYIYDETQSRIDGDAATLASYNVLAAAVGSSLAALVTEINLAVTAGTANASAISELTASVGDDIAALSDQVALNVTAIGANATAITTLSTTLGDDIAAVATTAQTNIDALTGEVNALYTAKVTVNGLVGGFGLANDGASVEAGFDVDTFWVGKTSADKRKPFIIDDGIVYIDSAMVGTLTADQIDTRGLTIKDNLGNVIFGAGNNLDWSRLTGSGKPADNATRNVFRGDWTTATVYQVGDIVMEAGYGWSALTGHTSSAIIRPPVYPVASNTQWTLYSLKGDPGLPGANGTRTAILEMYRNSAAAPTTFPSGNSTYTWATGQFTDPGTLNSWSRTPPAPVGGQDLWVIRQLYSDNSTTADSVVGWSATTPRISAASGEPGADGINGARTAYLEVYKWSTDTPTVFPTGTSTYIWATGEFTPPSTANGWALVPGAQSPGQTLWAYATRLTNTTTVTNDVVTWATSTPFAIGAAGINGAAGANAVTALLSNEAHVFPAAANGTVASYLDSGTQIRVYEGTTELVYNGVGTSASTWTISSAVVNITRGALTSAGSGLSVGVHSGVAAGTDVSSITYTITGRNAANQAFTLVKTQTFSKSKTGAVGDTGPTGLSASAYWLQTSAPAIQKSLAGAYTPASVTYSIFSATGTAAPVAYAGRFIIATSTDGTAYGAPVYTSAVNESSRSYTIPAGIKTVRVRAYLADGTTTLVDELISTVVSDGATGGTGPTGPTGLDGITIVLSNEAHTLPASSIGAVSSYSGSGTTVSVYEGATALSASASGVVSAFRIGTITQSPAATLTTGAASYAGTTATIGVHSGMVNGTDTVVLTIPVTVYRANGTSVTVNKLQTLTKSKAGIQGDVGSTGPTGPSAVAYWLQTSAPAIQKNLAGAYTPASVTYSMLSATGTAGPATYAGRFIIATSTDGTTYGSPVYTSGVNETSTVYTIPAGIKTVRVRAYLAGGVTTLLDELISTVVTDGATGSTGGTGPTGATGLTGPTGLDGITVVLSNEAHTLPASFAGAVSSYAGSGTAVSVYEGATALSASASAVVSAFRIGTITQAPAATLTTGAVSYAGTTATVAVHSAMVNGTDAVVLTVPVTIYRANGTSVTVNKLQTLTKSKAGNTGATGGTGATGPAGPTVVLTSDRFATFTATDGVLDSAQANIVLTATTQGLTGPTFAWSFSGLQTNPTASTTSTQTITSAQFGTSKAAIITCTVNGLYVDKMTIVRLEKSTAAAGATVNQTDAVTNAAILAAQTQANTATTNAATANTALADMASDSKFTPVEKQAAKLEWAALYAEKAGINASAAAQNITTENTAYNDAFQALGTYLNNGVAYAISGTHPSWITGTELTNTTDITGSVFRTTWANVYSARQVLLNKIAEVVSTSLRTVALVNQVGMTITGNTVVKTSGGAAWNASFTTKDSYTGGAYISFSPRQANAPFMIGLNGDNPVTSATDHYIAIDYALYCKSNGDIETRENNGNILTRGTYVAGDHLAVTYDGSTVKYWNNGAVLGSPVNAAANLRLYGDSSFYTIGSAADRIQFGPYGNPSAVQPSNPITAGNASSFIANAAIGNAHIGNLAVDTLQIADNAVTVGVSTLGAVGVTLDHTNYKIMVTSPAITTDGVSRFQFWAVIPGIYLSTASGWASGASFRIRRLGSGVSSPEITTNSSANGTVSPISIVWNTTPPAGTYTFVVEGISGTVGGTISAGQNVALSIIGIKK